MATFNIWLDKRNPKNRYDQFNLTIRACIKNDVVYLNISKMTEKQYHHVFVKKSTDEESIKVRDTCNAYISKCERIFRELNPNDKQRFREQFFKKDKEIPHSLLLKDLFQYYIDSYEDIKLKTRNHFRTTMNILEAYRPGLMVQDITADFLKKVEKKKIEDGCSRCTIDSHNRNIRRIINYFTHEEKLIPAQYEYPYGKSGYSIKNFFPKKIVMTNPEIKSIIEFEDFDNSAQEYARDIWLFLYRSNGINFADLLRMRWDSIKGNCFIFFRKKTETTRKNNIKEIVVPIYPKLQEIIDKVGFKDSPFVIGKLKEGYTESTFINKSRKVKREINKNLTIISNKLNLSVPLKMLTARDSYASTLKRAGISKDIIGEMLGHSNSVVTEHYLDSLDSEDTFGINDFLF
jgi:integrase